MSGAGPAEADRTMLRAFARREQIAGPGCGLKHLDPDADKQAQRLQRRGYLCAGGNPPDGRMLTDAGRAALAAHAREPGGVRT